MNELKLIPMTESEYDSWSVKSRENYCKENIVSGMSKEEAQKKTDEDFNRLLPLGLKTPEHYIYAINNKKEWIGILWFGIKGPADNRKAYIYDIVIEDAFKGKGFGKQAMTLLEDKVRELGFKHIGLHVFGHNKVAHNLYVKLGYEATNIVMEKKL